jgi:hypothetical protein
MAGFELVDVRDGRWRRNDKAGEKTETENDESHVC